MAELGLEHVAELAQEVRLGQLAVSSSKRGWRPSSSWIFAIALASSSNGTPVWSWTAAKDWIRGVVRTPPKSEITVVIVGCYARQSR